LKNKVHFCLKKAELLTIQEPALYASKKNPRGGGYCGNKANELTASVGVALIIGGVFYADDPHNSNASLLPSMVLLNCLLS
jgi:hypothetical protein